MTTPGANPASAGDTAPARPHDWMAILVVMVATLVAYAPMVDTLVQLALRTTQAVNAFVLLAFTLVDAIWNREPPLRWRLRVTRHGIVLFALACVAMLAATLFGLWPLSVVGLCLNAAALLSFVFGRDGVIPFYPALVALGLVAAMLMVLPWVDGALRVLAARSSAALLGVLGFHADLVARLNPLTLVLVMGGGRRAFEVAPECNGFGILLSAMVISAIFAVRLRYPWYGRGLLVLAGLLLGLVFNALRIVAICVVTLRTDLDYDMIHEGLGTAVYLLALAAVSAVALWPRRRSRRRGLNSGSGPA